MTAAGPNDAPRDTGIPDELVDAALDGEVNDDLHDEIVRALKYDRAQRERVAETLDAIHAMRDVPSPDFRLGVLNTLDRRRVFMPEVLRRMVRTGRMGVAAALLLTLMVVSALQTVSPRFATIAPHETPVQDTARAIGNDGASAAQAVETEVRRVYAVMGPWALVFDPRTPGGAAPSARVDRAADHQAAGASWFFADETTLLAPLDEAGPDTDPIPALP